MLHGGKPLLRGRGPAVVETLQLGFPLLLYAATDAARSLLRRNGHAREQPPSVLEQTLEPAPELELVPDPEPVLDGDISVLPYNFPVHVHGLKRLYPLEDVCGTAVRYGERVPVYKNEDGCVVYAETAGYEVMDTGLVSHRIILNAWIERRATRFSANAFCISPFDDSNPNQFLSVEYLKM